MYFQALDDKKHCVGIYYNGNLIFDQEKFPKNLSDMRTWKYSGFLDDDSIKYGWLLSEGKTLLEACPEELKPQLKKYGKKMNAFKKSFELAKIDFREHCFFDLVPHDFLQAFLEFKNQVTAHVFETHEEQEYYEHLASIEKLLYKIRYQELNINNKNARSLFTSSMTRNSAQKLLNGSKYIDYNIFGTRTGRLSTNSNSFPILTMPKELRMLIKPVNDWFISLDYNGAEARTVLGLLDIEQPTEDVHQWNIETILRKRGIEDREAAKTFFFSWLYNPASNKVESSVYDREAILERYYFDKHVHTIFNRKLEVDDYKAVNYIIQSTTADLVNERAVAIDKFLEGKKSFISHIVHDEVVVDMPDDERYLIPEMRDIFSNNRLGNFKTNLKAGQDYMEIGVLNL